MEIPVTIVGKDAASAPIQAGFDKIKRSGTETSSQVGRRFKDMGVDIARDFSGSAGQIVGHLGRLPTSLGIVSAAALATGAALTRMVTDYAKENAKSNAEAVKFNAHIENLKTSASDLADTIAAAVIPAFNELFSLFGSNVNVVEEFRKATAETEKEAAEWATELLNKGREHMAQVDEEYQFQMRMNKLKQESITLEAKLAEEQRKRDDFLRQARQNAIMESIDRRTAAELGPEDSYTTRLLERGREAVKNSEEREASFQETMDSLDSNEIFFETGKEVDAIVNGIESMSEGIGRFLVLGEKANVNFRQIAQTIMSDVVSALTQAALKAALLSFISPGSGLALALSKGENGMLALQSGAIVRRPTFAMIGENGPEAVIPLSQQKSSQREALLAKAGLSSTNTINVNINNVKTLDEQAIKTILIPQLNRLVRSGENLVSSSSLR